MLSTHQQIMLLCLARRAYRSEDLAGYAVGLVVANWHQLDEGHRSLILNETRALQTVPAWGRVRKLGLTNERP